LVGWKFGTKTGDMVNFPVIMIQKKIIYIACIILEGLAHDISFNVNYQQNCRGCNYTNKRIGMVEFVTIQDTGKINSVAYTLFEVLAHDIVSNFTNKNVGGSTL